MTGSTGTHHSSNSVTGPDPEGGPAGRGGRGRAGPGWLVAAAFIGPGTVTTATVAGAGFGTALLWALLFSTLATMILQEMSARLGLVTGSGLGEAMRARFPSAMGRLVSMALIIGAIAIGNAAYETGNLLGGALGLSGVFGGRPPMWALVIGAVGAAVLWTGSYRVLERLMVGLVGVMALAFLGTVVVVFPALPDVARGLFVPSLPDGSILTVVGLIGTTVVPYNLFLHASTVSEKWGGEGPEALPEVRQDLVLSIAVGGAVSMAILLTSAGTIFEGVGGGSGGTGVASAADMARQLEPLLGSWARIFFGVGLFAAGMTSAITAPLAAAYAVAGAAGWDRDLRSPRVRAVWAAVLATGVTFALTGVSPVAAILFAQAANGILLPVVAIFLVVTVNDSALLGEHRNTWRSNLLGGLVVLVSLLLGGRALLSVAGLI
jgi:Mn2+/Fe2+ NRAMP family transporter